jgi:hypothetical protein
MGHNSWIARVERIEAAQRAEASAELIADAVALVDSGAPTQKSGSQRPKYYCGGNDRQPDAERQYSQL